MTQCNHHKIARFRIGNALQVLLAPTFRILAVIIVQEMQAFLVQSHSVAQEIAAVVHGRLLLWNVCVPINITRLVDA